MNVYFDDLAKEIIKEDAADGHEIARNLVLSERMQKAPDVDNLTGLDGSVNWYDWMTDSPGEWEKHAERYAAWGRGRPIYWNQFLAEEAAAEDPLGDGAGAPAGE